jgi:NADP-dependent aldehyde dehydrogenase
VSVPTQSIDPRTGEPFGPLLEDTAPAELDAVLDAAAQAARPWARTSGTDRAAALRQVADALDGASSDLVPLADRETGLGTGRLTGELARTTFQLRMFADAVSGDRHLRTVVEHADPAAPPVGHPDLRRTKIPLGPVAVFGASNFPFAFSVPGGDTASALAAGCPVVVKAHPAHPQTSEATARIIRDNLRAAGAPDGVLALVRGFEAGPLLVRDPRIRAGAFTGSPAGGRALFDLATSRPDPIPFYGELGSVNPVVVTPLAATRGAALATEYVDSLALGTGQFCTNPGLLFVPRSSGLLADVERVARERVPGVMLSGGVASLFAQSFGAVAATPGVRIVLEPGTTTESGAHSSIGLLAIDAQAVVDEPSVVRTECFGPGAVVVEYDDLRQVVDLVDELEGCLVATVHGQEGEPDVDVLVAALASISGRVVWNGWPTGVAVAAAQQHGGPYPSTTSSLHTSVGTAALERFLRPVTFQSLPESLLPAELRD